MDLTKLSAMSDELTRITGITVQPQLTKESIGGALRASAKVQRFLRGPKPKAKVIPKKKPSTAGKWGRAALISGGLAVGGAALGASTILQRHHEMQMGQQIPLHYRPQ